jgi:hypothetical protein
LLLLLLQHSLHTAAAIAAAGYAAAVGTYRTWMVA